MSFSSARGLLAAGLLLGASLLPAAAVAQQPVTIGMVTTLSTSGGYLGQDVRDAFLMAIAEEDGKLGGVPVRLLVEDDGLKPADGRQIVERFLKRDNADIVTGVIFSNVAVAVAPSVLAAGKFYISPNAGPSDFAGEKCDPNYFVVSWQNDSLHEAAGAYAQELGYGNAFILAPNYPAGRDALTGFKRFFKGNIAGEIYTKLGQKDYAAELAQIRAANPDMVFHFLPGGMGIDFMKQYVAGGFRETTPLVVSAPSMDTRIMGALGDAALGVRSASHWNSDFDNPANRAFVEGFEAAYGRTPTAYAAQGYDTAKLIASALRAVDGDMSRQADFRAALKRAEFDAVRGGFAFGANNHPVQDWYSLVVEKNAAGETVNRTTGKVLEKHGDAYAAQCRM